MPDPQDGTTVTPVDIEEAAASMSGKTGSKSDPASGGGAEKPSAGKGGGTDPGGGGGGGGGGSGGSGGGGGDEPEPEPEPEQTFFEFQLCDAGGNPVEGEEVTVHLPDGETEDKQTDASGKVRVDGIDVGKSVSITLKQRFDYEFEESGVETPPEGS